MHIDCSTLRRRDRSYFRAVHLVIILGAAVCTSILVGALLVGDSMRGSLRDTALRGLGGVQSGYVGPRPITLKSTDAVAASLRGIKTAPLIVSRADAVVAKSLRRAGGVSLYGVDERFWRLNNWPVAAMDSQEAMIGSRLAADLDLGAGDDVILRFENRQMVPVDTLLGRRDELARSIRLRVSRIIADDAGGVFSVGATGRKGRVVLVPLATLQKALKLGDRTNAWIVGTATEIIPGKTQDAHPARAAATSEPEVEQILQSQLSLDDFGLRITDSPDSMIVESRSMLIEPGLETAISRAANASGLVLAPAIAYVVNRISTESGDRSVPYSTACGISGALPISLIDGKAAPALKDQDAIINEWTAGALSAKAGDTIHLSFFVSRPMGRLEEIAQSVHIVGIAKMEQSPAFAHLIPEYEGVTDARRISDWNPPFPMDMKRIAPRDEAYWDKFKAAPKVLVSIDFALRHWAEHDPRHGRYTSFQILSPACPLSDSVRARFRHSLEESLPRRESGFIVRPLRQEALASAVGGTDFGMLFVGFSFFLIFSAAMLLSLMFRLHAERRAAELGLLLAVGWPRRLVRRRLLGEAGRLACVGTMVGVLAALGYAWLMLEGLKNWWSEAGQLPDLQLHVSAVSLVVGVVTASVLSLGSMAWSLRGMVTIAPTRLLRGDTVDSRASRSRIRWMYPAAIALGVCGLLMPILNAIGLMDKIAAFFACGALLLIAGLIALRARLTPSRVSVANARWTSSTLAWRNASRNPRRSLIVVALTACACFLIVAVGANRHGVGDQDTSKTGGTGGFTLMGESVAPIAYDLNQADAQSSLGLSQESRTFLKSATILSARAREGDDASCRNLAQIQRPLILGVSKDFIARGGFSFTASEAANADERTNPWLLLHRPQVDGAIPCVADANTVQWLLHSGLGRDFPIEDDRGQIVRLRFVALLAPSILQGGLLISEDAFARMFPSSAGYSRFLVACDGAAAADLEQALEHDLAAYGLDLESSANRLREFLAVENTYLSAFQLLGGLGLILGVCGLALVLLRSLLERRRELAVLQAVGYRQSNIARLVFSENAMLLIAGVSTGALCALLAVAPHLLSTASRTPWQSLILTLAAVVAAGLASIASALHAALRAPLLDSLRRE